MRKILIMFLLARKKSCFEIVRIGGRNISIQIEEYIPANEILEKYETIVGKNKSGTKETTAATVVTRESINGLSNIQIANEFYKLVDDKSLDVIMEIGKYIEIIAVNRKWLNPESHEGLTPIKMSPDPDCSS